MAELLLSKNARVRVIDTAGLTPLHFAAMRGCLAVLEELMRHGAGFSVKDAFSETPLHMARNGEVTRALCARVKPEDRYKIAAGTALCRAAALGRADVVEALCEQKWMSVRSKNYLEMQPLHCAKNAEVAKILLRHGAERDAHFVIRGDNRVPDRSLSPLDVATFLGRGDVADLLRPAERRPWRKRLDDIRREEGKGKA